MQVLVFNPGGNSLKVELVACEADQPYAFMGRKLISLAVEGIGKEPRLLLYEDKQVVEEQPAEAASYGDAARYILRWMERQSLLGDVACLGLRVVHGGSDLQETTPITSIVEKKIAALEDLAPLHNKSSLELLAPVRERFDEIPLYAVFDTAFHRTIPAHAAVYALPWEISERHRICRYGFHGISHRYQLERYARLAGKPIEQCTLITTHLESGCSVTAIAQGKSIDNTMGLTPLEGLVMGTRSGDIDPSIIPLLMKREGLNIDEVMTLLNKRSGLLGISGDSLDTRILMQHYESNPRVRLAMDLFAYRVRKAVGAMLAALGHADAIIFGGGIGENTPFVRTKIAEGLRPAGFELDAAANVRLTRGEGRLSTPSSKIEAWVIPVEEGLQIAHECCQAMAQA